MSQPPKPSDPGASPPKDDQTSSSSDSSKNSSESLSTEDILKQMSQLEKETQLIMNMQSKVQKAQAAALCIPHS